MGSNKRYPGHRHYWTVEEWRDADNIVLPPIAKVENATAGREAFAAAVAAFPDKLLTLCWGARIIERHPDSDWPRQRPIMPVYDTTPKD